MKIRIVGLVLCLIGAFAVGAGATPIHHDETVSGDLGDAPPYTSLALNVGSNTISGSQHLFSVPGGLDSDFDDVAFTVPSGAALTNITYVTTPTSDTPGKLIYWLTSGNGFLGPQLGNQLIDVPTLSPIFSTAMPLGPGTYSLFNFGLGVNQGLSWADTYTWTLDVEPQGQATVPDTTSTAALLLLSTGLLGLVAHDRI
jgi:hypothetical protein